jgi:crotonobetainyl-CoA:carnitine CoA-transferase CaiB-like acyl-CoA transferase
MKLEGLRVVDLSLFLPGPALTQLMADHGATVIKVEPPGEGEPNRHIGARQDGVSVFFRNTHRGKRSVSINLKHEAGREALLRIAERADVFVEAFRPGVVDRLGVGYAAVAASNPRIVYCSISGYGQAGAFADLPAYAPIVQAASGYDLAGVPAE